jgi:hypothetical protein
VSAPVRWTLAALLVLPTLAPGAELRVEGRVLAATPVTETRTRTERVGDCTPRRPAGDDVVALLAFDLRADCRTVRRDETVTLGWRVRYEWDGRVHERVLDERPGETLTLRVRLD